MDSIATPEQAERIRHEGTRIPTSHHFFCALCRKQIALGEVAWKFPCMTCPKTTNTIWTFAHLACVPEEPANG